MAIGDYCTWNTSLKDCFGNQVIEYIIGNKVNGIAPCAFRNCSNMTSITIPNSVTSIGENAFYGCSKLTNISIPNNLTSIESKTFYNCSALTSIAIPNAVASIGNSAFENCTNLETLSLGESISKYGENAFAGCPNISSIYNYRERPAKLGTETFKDVDYFECTLYVLAGSVDMYKSSGSDWKDFYFIEPIGAAAVTTEDVQVTPTETTAAVMWPTVENAATYELVIRDKSGNVVCTLIFNSNGQLTSIAFAAPGRILSSVQSAGFSFTVTGLDSGTRYNLTLNAKDDKGMVLQSTTQSFTTTGGVATALEPVESSAMVGGQKFLRDGHIFILRDGKTYTVQGQEVR